MKENADPNQLNKPLSFWFFTGLLVILLASLMARDIDRPFYGLHSWDEAGAAWRARNYLKYDFKYTKGFAVWAVGDPPTVNPNRSLDHPQLKLWLPTLEMRLFGMNERAMRIGRITRALISLLVFLVILKGLTDDKTALLIGLIFILFPITGYFAGRSWVIPGSLSAIWCYLVIIGALKNAPPPKNYHKYILAVLLFLILQFAWEGFCYALAIGVHYVFRCIRHKKLPDKALLAILIIAPLSSLLLNFTIMAAGHNWHWQTIWELYKWRASKGEMPEFLWSKWFERVWQHALTNYTRPVLIIAIVYLTFGQLFVFMVSAAKKITTATQRRFPQFWLFMMPALFQLFIFRGAIWPHQYWEAPLSPVIAISVAMAIMLLNDTLTVHNRRVANAITVVLMAVVFVSCMNGLNYYFSVRWQPPAKIEMFKNLNENIPPDKMLLSFEDFKVNQHKVKGTHYRPEIAWYLDREIIVAQTIEDIRSEAKTGKYKYYLVPVTNYTLPLINQLAKQYKYEYVPGQQSKMTKDGKFLEAGMLSYYIFNLYSSL